MNRNDLKKQAKYLVGKTLYTANSYLERMEQHYLNEKIQRSLKRIGAGCRFNGRIKIVGAESIVIGNNVHIGDGAFIRGNGGLTIGDNTHISRNLVLYTVNHDWTGQRLPYDDLQKAGPVLIEENVWIGMNVCITPGTQIGQGAIIGMGTTVSGVVEPMTIIVGDRNRNIGHRDEAHYCEKKKLGDFGGVNGTAIEPEVG
jgi:acetyltransferase-like isoleucine patch superfamily enzyme